MEDLIYTDNVTLDYSEARANNGNEKYRLSVYDKYNHFLDDIYLSKTHLRELFEGLKNVDLSEDEFY